MGDFVAFGTPPFLPGAAWPSSDGGPLAILQAMGQFCRSRHPDSSARGRLAKFSWWAIRNSSGHEKICRGQHPDILARAWLAKFAWWAIGNFQTMWGLCRTGTPTFWRGLLGQARMVNISTESLSAHLKISTERLSAQLKISTGQLVGVSRTAHRLGQDFFNLIGVSVNSPSVW